MDDSKKRIGKGSVYLFIYETSLVHMKFIIKRYQKEDQAIRIKEEAAELAS